MYGIPKYRITYENILGVEKYYILNNSDGTSSFVEEGTENAIEVYGMFMEYDQQIEVPLFVPEVPNEVQDSDCYIFTGNWNSYVALEGNDTLNCSLPCDVYTITTEPVEDLIDGCPFVFFTPEFIQTKARADFYAEDGTTLIESIYCPKNYFGAMCVIFPSIPEKTGFVGYWTDSSNSKFNPGEEINISGTSKDFVLVYEEQ